MLGGYGTGAIMAVPAHDERDYEFAQTFSLPLRQVIEPVTMQTIGSSAFHKNEPFVDSQGVIVLLKHWGENKYLGLKWRDASDWGTLLTGGIDKDVTAEETARREITEETGYKNIKAIQQLTTIHSKYYHVPKKLNRFGHAPVFVVELADGEKGELALGEEGRHEPQWLTPDELKNFLTAESHQLALRFLLGEVYTGPGIVTNSDKFNGLDSKEAGEKLTAFVGGRMVKSYRLRDWLISRQRYWGAPIPVVYDPEGKPHTVPEDHLPWLLPTDVEFKPTGTSPLGQSRELRERTEKIFGNGWRPEIDTMDTFVCSSWYFYRFADPHNDKEFASKEMLKKWLPVDLYIGGAEHTVLHLLYARFFTKVLHDMDYIAFSEPFLKLRHQGIILAEDSRKMSKRWGNVINPDDVVERFGADSLRLYEMFMGPLEQQKPWNMRNINGVRRFLERVWNVQEKVSEDAITLAIEILLNQTIKKVGEDIEALKFNTAISALMILLNALEELSATPRGAYKLFLQLLAPLAPHITHELAEREGFAREEWERLPLFDATKLAAEKVVVAVQVNGKLRASIELNPSTPENEALSAGRAAAGKWLTEPEKKSIYVPGKVINFVV